MDMRLNVHVDASFCPNWKDEDDKNSSKSKMKVVHPSKLRFARLKRRDLWLLGHAWWGRLSDAASSLQKRPRTTTATQSTLGQRQSHEYFCLVGSSHVSPLLSPNFSPTFPQLSSGKTWGKVGGKMQESVQTPHELSPNFPPSFPHLFSKFPPTFPQILEFSKELNNNIFLPFCSCFYCVADLVNYWSWMTATII